MAVLHLQKMIDAVEVAAGDCAFPAAVEVVASAVSSSLDASALNDDCLPGAEVA